MEYLIKRNVSGWFEQMKFGAVSIQHRTRLQWSNHVFILILEIATVVFLNCRPAFSQTSSTSQPNAAAAANELDVHSFAGVPAQIGSADGYGSAARFYAPSNVWASGGNIYVTDYVNSTIRKISQSDASVTTLAGQAGFFGSADGTAANAQFGEPLVM